MSVFRLLAACLILLSCTACQSVGPPTIQRDQFDYNKAISVSRKEQLLLNMVRLRYGEAPVFLSVASVISQYSIEGALTATAPSYDRPNSAGAPIASGSARYTDRPTITYQPLTGKELAGTLLSPVPLNAAFALIQSGYAIDMTLKSTVRTLNGMPSYTREKGIQWNHDFLRAVDALSRVSGSGAGSVRLDGDHVYYVLHPKTGDEAQASAVAEFRTAMGLDPSRSEYELVISAYRGSSDQITITMSSVLDILNVISAQFEVPQAHISSGWTYQTLSPGSTSESLIVVHASAEEPEHPFVATSERGYWFWIDESDYASKRAFSFLTMLLTLAESGGDRSPLVTIGAGGP